MSVMGKWKQMEVSVRAKISMYMTEPGTDILIINQCA